MTRGQPTGRRPGTVAQLEAPEGGADDGRGAMANDRAVQELLGFYRRDLREGPEGLKVLKKLCITTPEPVDHFQLGYCSGRALAAANEAQYEELLKLDLAFKRQERLIDCVVVPVFNGRDEPVDLCGLRLYPSGQLRIFNWKRQPTGLIGANALRVYPEVILCESPMAALHVRQLGHQNVIALRGGRDGTAELRSHVKLLQESGTRRVYVVSRQQCARLAEILAGAGIEAVQIQVPLRSGRITAGVLSVIGRAEARQPARVRVELLHKTDTRLTFQAGEVTYRVDAVAGVGLGIRTRVRAERRENGFIDRVDLAAAAGRAKFAKACGPKLGLPGQDIEGHLNAIADRLDGIEAEVVAASARAPRELNAEERQAAEETAKNAGFFQALTDALAAHFGLVGEEANKKLAILVAASRLLDKPSGGIVRGAPGSGKSELIHGVGKLLPPSEVLYFSRLTSQALYFMPKETLLHRLLLVDEYEGLENAEYPLRTMMSAQTLSLAITLREGGKVPVTRTIEIPASLAVLVSTTRAVNIENLSRFIELRTDDSPAQTQRVVKGLAVRSNGAPKPPDNLATLQNAFGMLKPCQVKIPFAERLNFSASNVLARRQFGHVISLIAAHAALMQAGRKRLESPDGGLVIQAEKADYAAVHPLLRHVVDHFEDGVSPAGLDLLGMLKKRDSRTITRAQVMEFMGWSYGKAHKVLKELKAFDLLVSDNSANGLLHTYEVAPFSMRDNVISKIAPPEAL